MKSLLVILLGGALVNNYVLQQYMGVCPVLGGAKDTRKAVGMGLAVTVIMVLAALVTWPLQTFVLEKLSIGYLQTLLFAVLIAAIVYLAEAVLKRLGKSLGAYLPVVLLNSAVLGVTIQNASAEYTFLESLFAAIGAGIGFLAALLLFAGVESKIDEVHVPKAFRGLPVRLLAASILSLAVLAYK